MDLLPLVNAAGVVGELDLHPGHPLSGCRLLPGQKSAGHNRGEIQTSMRAVPGLLKRDVQVQQRGLTAWPDAAIPEEARRNTPSDYAHRCSTVPGLERRGDASTIGRRRRTTTGVSSSAFVANV